MRALLTLSVIVLVPFPVLAQGKKASKEPGPVKVIDFKRKDPVVYEKEVETIFYKKCITCHSGNVKESKFDISSYEGLVKGGKRGTAIVPGNAENSLLYKVAARTAKPFMPPVDEGPPVTPEELALIKAWIDQGAKAPTGKREIAEAIVDVPPGNVHPVRAVAVSPDKTIVASGRGNQIHLYDANTGNYLRSLYAPGLKSPKGKEVKAAHLSIVESMTYSPDGKFLVSGSFKEITIWDPNMGTQLHKITGFAHAVVALAFSPEGQLLATGGGEPTADGEVKIFEVPSWKLSGEIKNGHSDTVYGLCFSPDLKLPITGEKDKFIQGKFLATASADKFIKVWELPSGKFVKSFEGHTHHVLDVGWQADGKLLASAGGDNTVKIWDFEKGEQVRTVNAHGKQVTRLLYIGKTTQFLTCGGDAAVKMFNSTNGAAVRTFSGNADFVYAVGVSPDGAVVAGGGQEGVVRLYNGTNGQILRSLMPPDAQPPQADPKKK